MAAFVDFTGSSRSSIHLFLRRPYLYPVEGINCQSPRARAGELGVALLPPLLMPFAKERLERDPVVARVDERRCAACFACRKGCPYRAVEEKEIRDRQGRLLRTVASVNPGVCGGCGTCQATCPSKSVELDGYTDEQIIAMIEAL